MKTMKSKFYSLALAAGMLTLTACSDDNTNDSNNDKGNGIENGKVVVSIKSDGIGIFIVAEDKDSLWNDTDSLTYAGNLANWCMEHWN